MKVRRGLIIQSTYLALWFASLILGYIGLRTYCTALHSQSVGASTSDYIYYDLELIFMQSTPLSAQGVNPPPPVPWMLDVARFITPTILAFGVAKLRITASAHHIHRTRLRRLHGHAVVFGSTRSADVIADKLRGERTQVVRIDEDGTSEDPYTITGSPTSALTLKEAGVSRASQVFVCTASGSRNAQIAHQVEQQRSGRTQPAKIHALVDDLELCASLRARRWSTGSDALHVDFFNPDELAARAVVARDDDAFAHGSPEIAIAGTGAFARSVLIEFVRRWIVRRRVPGERMRALLIGPDAGEVAARLRERYAFLGDACVIDASGESVEQILVRRHQAGARRLTRLYLCQDREDEALRSALGSVAAHLRSTLATAVLRLDRMAGLATTFHGERGGLFDALGGRLQLVDATVEGCDPSLIDQDMGEELARACHQHYVLERLNAGDELGESPALLDWDRLAEPLRASNRDQAADIGRKLVEIGCLLAPRSAVERDFAYLDGELEHLARLEHARWLAERRRDGWEYGPVRDYAARKHPCLVPWEDLPEPERQKDRETVLTIPVILADAGLSIVRT